MSEVIEQWTDVGRGSYFCRGRFLLRMVSKMDQSKLNIFSKNSNLLHNFLF